MAGKGGKKKDTANAPKANPGKMLGLVQKLCAVLTVVLAVVLFLGAYNVLPASVSDMLFSYAVGPIALLGLTALGMVLPGAAIRKSELEALEGKLAEFETRLDARVAEAKAHVDAHIGEDYQALREENRALHEKLEQFQQAEKSRVDDEIEKLRSINVELEDQIKKWAIGSVDQIMSETGTETVKVA